MTPAAGRVPIIEHIYEFRTPPSLKVVPTGPDARPLDVVRHLEDCAKLAGARFRRDGGLGRPVWVVTCPSPASRLKFRMIASDIFALAEITWTECGSDQA